MNINDNSINIMNHIITIDDMIDDLYYRTDIAWAKNKIGIKLLYLNNLNEKDKNKFYYLINSKISNQSKIANYKKPIFKFIDMKSYEYNYEYYLDIEYTDYKNSLIQYKINDKENYKIRIYQNSDDKFKFNYKDWNNHISYLEPFYSTLKFKIKEEKITRNVRNDLNLLKKSNYTNFINLSKEIRELKNTIRLNNEYYNNEILNIKKYLYWIIIFIIVIILY